MRPHVSSIKTENGLSVPVLAIEVDSAEQDDLEILAGDPISNGVEAVGSAREIFEKVAGVLTDLRDQVKVTGASSVEAEIAVSIGGEAGWFIGKVQGSAGITIKAVWSFDQ